MPVNLWVNKEGVVYKTNSVMLFVKLYTHPFTLTHHLTSSLTKRRGIKKDGNRVVIPLYFQERGAEGVSLIKTDS